jgi:hypothetical protein
MNEVIEALGLAPVRWSAWLGVWCVLFMAWLVMLVLWVRTVLKYNKAYREYEQAYRKYEQSCREYEKPPGQLSEELRLDQESLGEFHQRHGVILKSLCRLGLIVGYTDLKGSPRKLVLGRDCEKTGRI